MSSVPSISVVLPVHNRETLVGRAIDSVLAQTFQDFELIIVDDASTDGTPRALERYQDDPRVRLFRNEQNLGAGGTRNRGISEAKGEYIAFQDSDDRWLPEKLARQFETLTANGDADACYCGAFYFAKEQCYYIPIQDSASIQYQNMSEKLLWGNPTTPQTLLIRKSLIESVGGFDETLKINEDWDLAMRLAQHTSFAFLDEPLVIIYRTPSSVSSNQIKDAHFRNMFLEKYHAIFSRSPGALSRQRYISGRLFMRNGCYRSAFGQFKASFSVQPGLRSLVLMLTSGVMAIFRKEEPQDQS